MSYGHDRRGVNVQNLRSLGDSPTKRLPGGYRAPHDWKKETLDHINQGNQEAQLSTTLRLTSKALELDAYEQASRDISVVDAAIQSKIGKTQNLKSALETAMVDTQAEINQLIRLRSELDVQMGNTDHKLAVNEQRMKVRSERPHRELTNDEVQKKLVSQQGVLMAIAERALRGQQLIDIDVKRLQQCLRQLEADLQDKALSVRIDEEVAGIPPRGSADLTGGSLAKRTTCYPHAWQKSTEDNIQRAYHWIADGQRLRKAIALTIKETQHTEKDLRHSLNSSMLFKMQETARLRKDLDAQLAKLASEKAKAEEQRSSLIKSLEDKKGPLNQAKQRYMLRNTRPTRERVNDEVEIALTQELNHLKAMSTKLTEKINAIDSEVAQLSANANSLQANIADKDASLKLDEHCIMLDGRPSLSRPPESVASLQMSDAGRSRASSARSSTLAKIAELEAELATAKKERMNMESTLANMRPSSTQ